MEILQGLLGSDLIGFQVPLHAENFLRSVGEVLGVRISYEDQTVQYDGRTIKVGVFPVVIDFCKWSNVALSGEVRSKALRIRSDLGVDQIILGVDRLDYTKGIPERLRAYERFLEKYREYHGRVCMLQITVPSQTDAEDYRVLRREVDEIIGRILGRFSGPVWVPLRYLYKTFPMEELAGYYAAANVALVTALRDGMNLVAQEYVASRSVGGGALIMSEFAGAAGLLRDCVLVNPYDIEQVGDSIARLLAMPEADKANRMGRLREAVKEQDVSMWCDSFLEKLTQGRRP